MPGDPSLRPAFETARLELARVHVDGTVGRDPALRAATRLSAQALGVARVGVWFLTGRALRCELVYERERDTFENGTVLELARYPVYARALRERRAIVASDAASDERTAELRDDYLTPNGIGSLLDAPIYEHGSVVGVVCHEHVGPPRAWTQSEVDFASLVADIASAILEQAARAELEAARADRAWQSAELHRLELLQDLAGAIAHDFNNVLAGIDLVAQQLARGPDVVDTAEAARTLAQSVAVGSRLVGDLGALRRRDGPAPVTLVAPAIEQLAHLLSPLVRSTAELRVEIENREACVRLDPAHVDQLVMNLCLNARDAIEEGGTVLVRVRSARLDEADGMEGAVAIDVEDDGSGIHPEHLPHVFDRYFTTKPSGSGQGLATVRRIVDDAGGRILVGSDPGRGTRFTLILPRASTTP